MLQKTPFSFDVSVWEFFWPLMSGARLVVAAPGDHRDPAKLVALINREGVDTVEEGKDAVPIGRPIANLACYILDGNLEPVPVGVLGELYLAGRGLARGYHQRPGLTAERLARYRADGVIEYAGRIDHQVKLRGLRIELGEIEARLLEHPWVREAAVLAVDGTNGKLDRKALPAPEVSVAQAGYSAPRNAMERTLAEIWQDLLGVERVGLDDNFFSLGGDSIVSIRPDCN
ncbi:hypothetical protein AOU28_06935 [Pseudomonas aeruginosa]|nr:hypothetical protein AOU28_06935 [Pseudomonas aeruginosa]